MRPAFTSVRQAGTFALLLLVLLLLPLAMPKSMLPPRREIYSSAPWGYGSFPYMREQIFDEKGDIDVLFMGSSRIWWGIDTPQVQRALGQKLGRKAVVRTLGWNNAGLDAEYFILRDVLEHRKVSVLVISDCSSGAGNTAHKASSIWFRVADRGDGLSGLSLRSKLTFYTGAMLGMPRNLFGLLRTNLPVIPSDEISWTGGLQHVGSPSFRLGALAVRERIDRPFADYTPHSNARASDVCIYSEVTKPEFNFAGNEIYPMQAAFLAKVGALAREYHVKLVYLHMPMTNEMKSPSINEPVFWPPLLGGDVTMMGIAPTKLFSGLSEEEILKLFYNVEHFNQNGQIYFTSLITPSLVQVYEDQANP
jgi:hypothetical protein